MGDLCESGGLTEEWMQKVASGVRADLRKRGGGAKMLGVVLAASALIAGGCAGSGGPAGSKGKVVVDGGKAGAVGRREPLPGAIVGNPEKAGSTAEVAAKDGESPSGKPVRASAGDGVKAKQVGKESTMPTGAPGSGSGGLPATDVLAGKVKAGGSSGVRAATPAQEMVAAPKAPPLADARNPGGAVGEIVVVAVKPGASAMKAGTIPARVGEQEVAAPLWFVYPEFATMSSGAGTHADAGTSLRVRDWIGTSVVWRTSRAIPKQVDGSSGFWVASVSAPDVEEGARGVEVVIDGRQVAVFRGGVEKLPRVRRVATSAFAREMLGGLRRSPMVRWRARLAAGEPLLAEQAGDAFADATLEGLARTTEREWAGVLARLNEADAELASRFASRLAGVVDIGEGVEIPVWPADANSGVAMESLLADVLRAGADRDRVARIAEAWLTAQPVGGAVVIDDAAAIDLRSGLTFPSVLLANLSDQPAAAMASRVETADPEMLRLEPFAAVFASVGAAAKVEDGGDPRRRTGMEAMRDGVAQRTMADVRVGDWRGKRAVVGEIAKIRPPGMDIGPLLSDWTQQTFLAAAMDETSRGEMQISSSVSGFGGRLKPADDQGGAAGPGRWLIMFEIVRPTGGSDGAKKEDRSELVLSFGPRGGTASQSLRVLADGSLFEVRNGQAMAAGNATMKRSGDRTFYWVPVPSAAIEAGKVLRVGLVRIDEKGRRSAWPRPMLPWQTEPGRIAVDLSSWSPVKE